MGGLIICHNLTLVQKNWPLKKMANVFGNQLKIGNYAGYQNKFIVNHLAHFLPLLKAPGDKLVPYSRISLKIGKIMWARNCVFLLSE